MKSIPFTLLLLITFPVLAQKAEPVYSFARVKQPVSWYKEQIKAWDKELKKNPQNALGWYYYYYANRNLMATDTSLKLDHKAKQEKLEATVERMGKQVPESYEYNLLMWKNHGFDMQYMPYL